MEEINKNIEPLLTGIQFNIQQASKHAIQNVASKCGLNGVRGTMGKEAVFKAQLAVIQKDIMDVLSKMEKYQPSEDEWEKIREICNVFVEVNFKSAIKERMGVQDDQSIEYNQSINIWREITFGSIKDFIDAKMVVLNKTNTANYETNKFRQDTLEELKAIRENTDSLNELVYLVRLNGEQQEEILSLIKDILSISNSHDKKDAESRYRIVMDKISKFNGDTDTVQKLMGFGLIVYNIIEPLLK